MQLELNLSWESLVYNPLLASKLKEAEVIYLYPSTIQQASEGLQQALMQAYVDYISVCFSAEIYNDEHITALNNLKRKAEKVWQEVYKIKSVHRLVDVKLEGTTISTFTVITEIEQSAYGLHKNLSRSIAKYTLDELFVSGATVDLDSKYIYRVQDLAGHDKGYLYQYTDRQGNAYSWVIAITNKLIW